MKKILLILCTAVISCSDKKEEQKVVVIPPNTMFIISDTPRTIAYKVDTTQPWVIFDSTATLKMVLKNLEDNYKAAIRRQKMLADTAHKK